ncbi:MAG: tRNA (N6-isopentenyl adenosine(37)-C2)-methylthiotransferase MiaB [Candidatus Parcubacteria bacterium]|nr:tRNA (N6-isopentenyl adenosine(37)-C2)-methylthiotransferase MiaB [Candidatus Parcubacteria bacterium]
MNTVKYWITTYGCQMNKSDSERIASVLENMNYRKASNLDDANLILVNACSIRQSAIDRIWGQTKIISKLKKKNPNIKAVLTGCVLKKDRIKFYGRFDLVLDIKDLPKLPKFLGIPKKTTEDNYLRIKPKYASRFSAQVPIMTGCNNFCSYCAVPYTRGREISRSAKEIICEVKNLVNGGYKEIWLLGENVNSFKSEGINFPELLKKINAIKGNFWIRFTSPHPKDFSDELIETIASSEKMAEYINLPIQSGDNTILKKMRRPYTVKGYKILLKKIREAIPGVAISTDVIVGFPGETKKNFENTKKLFKELKFDMAYIAQYSSRAGTAASLLKDNVSHSEKEKRHRILTDILRETAAKNNKEYEGKTVEVLVDDSKNGFMSGKTRTFKTARFKGKPGLIGKFVEVKIIEALPWGLKSELCKTKN